MIAVNQETKRVFFVCDGICAELSNLVPIKRKFPHKFYFCVHCSYCGMRVEGGKGRPCWFHAIGPGDTGSLCPSIDTTATFYFKAVAFLVAPFLDLTEDRIWRTIIVECSVRYTEDAEALAEELINRLKRK